MKSWWIHNIGLYTEVNAIHHIVSYLCCSLTLLHCFQSNYHSLYGSDSTVSVDTFRENEPGRTEEMKAAMFQESTGKVKSFKEKLKIYPGEDRAALMHYICN